MKTVRLNANSYKFGEFSEDAAHLQLNSLLTAIAAVKAGQIDAIVTAPWTKALFSTIGQPAWGHTEILAREFECEDNHVMMLAGPRLRVSLVTTHVPLSAVPELVTQERIVQTTATTIKDLKRLYGVDAPRIAICGLNPHAGEKGNMGFEDISVIEPAIATLRKQFSNCKIAGPLPADTLFPRFAKGQPYDAVIAMYHDQGLIPLKTLHFGESINVTLGLPTIRTSVDHGSAYDIAGQNKADGSSMRVALEAAVSMVNRRD